MPEARWRRDGKLPFQELQGQVVVVVPVRRDVHTLDEAATVLWNALARDRSVKELVDVIRDEFEVEADEAEKDVKEFLASMEEKGLAVRA